MLILPPSDIFDRSASETVSTVSDTQQAPSSELPEINTSSGKRISEKLKKAIDSSRIEVIALDFQPLPIIEDKASQIFVTNYNKSTLYQLEDF
ncbi:hypothetical protein Trydic_g13795 [Trypoxylus dichotomus]